MGDGSSLSLEREQGTQRPRSEVSLCDLYGVQVFKKEVEETSQINEKTTSSELDNIHQAVFSDYERIENKEVTIISENVFSSTAAITKYDVVQSAEPKQTYGGIIAVILTLITVILAFTYANKKKKEREDKIAHINDCYM